MKLYKWVLKLISAVIELEHLNGEKLICNIHYLNNQDTSLESNIEFSQVTMNGSNFNEASCIEHLLGIKFLQRELIYMIYDKRCWKPDRFILSFQEVNDAYYLLYKSQIR